MLFINLVSNSNHWATGNYNGVLRSTMGLLGMNCNPAATRQMYCKPAVTNYVELMSIWKYLFLRGNIRGVFRPLSLPNKCLSLRHSPHSLPLKSLNLPSIQLSTPILVFTERWKPRGTEINLVQWRTWTFFLKFKKTKWKQSYSFRPNLQSNRDVPSPSCADPI